MISSRRFSFSGYTRKNISDEQLDELNSLFPSPMRVRVFQTSDFLLIADCGDERPICIGSDGNWEFINTPRN